MKTSRSLSEGFFCVYSSARLKTKVYQVLPKYAVFTCIGLFHTLRKNDSV